MWIKKGRDIIKFDDIEQVYCIQDDYRENVYNIEIERKGIPPIFSTVLLSVIVEKEKHQKILDILLSRIFENIKDNVSFDIDKLFEEVCKENKSRVVR